MKTITNKLFVLLFFLSGIIICRTTDDFPTEETKGLADTVYTMAEEMPNLIGGMESLQKNIHYPEEAKKAGTQGKVFVSLTIDESGKVIQADIMKSVDKYLDAAALEAVSKISFTPAKKAGKPAKSRMLLPIDFKLDGENHVQTDESQPFPIGGMEAIMKNVKYPEKAKKANTQGKVIVRAVVDKNGNVVETKILLSVSPECDAAASKAVKSVKFTPGKKDGKAVRTEVVIPIMFKLQ